MTLEALLQNAWLKTKLNVASRQYLKPSNYVSDVIAGGISRTPFYAAVDNGWLDVPAEHVLHSAGTSLAISTAGYSLLYTFGNSMLASALGEKYLSHAKKIDAAYSAVMTFGFGLVVNAASGYTVRQTLVSSAVRASMAIPLGPVTRYYTDAFREARGAIPAVQRTGFHGASWQYSAPRIASMMFFPLALAGSVLLSH